MGSVCFEWVVCVLNWLCVLGLAPDAIMMVANRSIVIVLNECNIKSRCRPRRSLPDVTLSSPEVAAGCHVVVPGSRDITRTKTVLDV